MSTDLYQPQISYGGKVYQPGVYDISNDEYHASVGISRSAISEVKKSPLHFWENYLNPNREKRKQTNEMTIGNAIHTLVLEPELFEKQFIVSEKVDGRTKEGKSYKANLEIAAKGKEILQIEDGKEIAEMVEAVQAHHVVSKLLQGAKIEKSIYWVDQETEILCKARPDAWTENRLVDLKTTEDATLSAFIGSAKKYNYHIQAAMQIDAIKEKTGLEIEHFIIVAIPKKKPHKPYIYRLGEQEIEQGRREYKDALKILRACFSSNCWDVDRDTIIDLNFPAYYLNNNVFNNLMEIYKCQTN